MPRLNEHDRAAICRSCAEMSKLLKAVENYAGIDPEHPSAWFIQQWKAAGEALAMLQNLRNRLG